MVCGGAIGCNPILRGPGGPAAALGASGGASGGDIFERKKGLALVPCCLTAGASAAGLTVSLDDAGEAPVLVTDFEDLRAEELGERVWLAQSNGLAALLSVGEDGAARVSFRLPGPQVVAYLGMCGRVE